jgi:plasmid replication initiation protein
MAEDPLISFGGPIFSTRQQGEEGDEFFLSRLDWSIAMHRVFLALLGKSEAWAGASFSACRASVRRIRDMAQVRQKSIYEEMAEATAHLVREPIEFGGAGKDNYEGYPIFSVCRYKSREGMIEAKFNQDARPYLLQLRDHFTQYRLRQAIPLSTPYAIRTYEIAKMIERPGERRSRQIPVGRFRQMFGLEDKYARHRDMRRRVIDPSVEQVNEKTDVDVRCTDVRDGQTPIALQWTVESSGSDQNEDEDAPSPRHVPASLEKSEHETWFEDLPPEEQKRVIEEARTRARKSGYTEDRPRSFSAGVMQMVSRIYREQTE